MKNEGLCKRFHVHGPGGHVGHVNLQMSVFIKLHAKYFPEADSRIGRNKGCSRQHVKRVFP